MELVEVNVEVAKNGIRDGLVNLILLLDEYGDNRVVLLLLALAEELPPLID